MFDYMTAQEAAGKWNVSLRWVQRLCAFCGGERPLVR